MAHKAIVAGASGLIGSNLLNILLQHPNYNEVLILVRKELGIQHPKLTQLIVDFDNLKDYSKLITGRAIFCCLGSTRKKTPDLGIYRKIDHDYPVQLAKIAALNGVKQYHLVSAIGADPSSSNFYTMTKGETEEDVKRAGLNTVHIYRPSLLTGDRKEYRFAEKVAIAAMKIIDPLLIGGLRKYRSIPAATVAWAMFKQSIKNEEGIFIYSSDQIKQLS